MTTLYDFQVTDIEGKNRKLSEFSGKLCLIVNVASECGLTPQYDGLQRLYTQYREAGLEILAFPCNQFGSQEPGSEAEIAEFCRRQYGVEFNLFGKVEVNGDSRAPLYAWLTSSVSEPDASGDIAWNFTKFLVDQEGQLIGRFASAVEPGAAVLVERIDQALKSR